MNEIMSINEKNSTINEELSKANRLTVKKSALKSLEICGDWCIENTNLEAKFSAGKISANFRIGSIFYNGRRFKRKYRRPNQ